MSLKGADSNGRQSDDDEGQDSAKHESNEEGGADINEENGDSAEIDPLAEAVVKFQSVVDALEKEVEKTREMGDETQKVLDDEASSSTTMFTLRENAKISFHSLKTNVDTRKEDDISNDKLKEANTITGREAEEIEGEIENLFKHKLEAECQYLVISRTVEKLKSDVADQVSLSDEIQTTFNVVRDNQSNISVLKQQADKLKTRVEDTFETEQVTVLHMKIREVVWYMFIQLVLLILVFVSFVSQLSPHNAGVVPT